MSNIRDAQSLCCTDRLSKNTVADWLPEAVCCCEMDAPTENRLHPMLEPHEFEEADRSLLIKLDDEIDIAVRTSLVAGHGAEDRQGRYVV